MRIAVVTPAQLPSRAASAVGVTALANALAKVTGLRSTLVFRCAANPDLPSVYSNYRLDPARVEVSSVGRVVAPSLSRYIFPFLAVSYAKGNVEAVITRSIPTAFLAARMDVTVVFDAHDLPEAKDRLAWWLLRRMCSYRAFKGVAVTNPRLRRMFIDNGLPESKLTLIPNGAELLESDTSLTVHSEPKNRLSVGYFGSVHQGRGIDLIIEIARGLPDVDFHVVGGSEEQADVWSGIASEVKNIRFVSHIPHAEVRALVSQMDVLLAPYQKQVFLASGRDTSAYMSPLKLFEYMASQRAIVASDIPAVTEVLGRTGCLLADPERPNDWIDAINRLRDDTLRSQLALKAFHIFQREYTWERRAERFVRLLGARVP